MDYNLRPLLEDAARALGMHPVDLATIISYETGGTFDPLKAGPTTEWGQHRGLIQWGEPQAKEYGVDWSNPLQSQLGENGAIVRYFKDRGWQPGMSLTDAYSIVNAGQPGMYNATDENNGGAPGTVAEKVRDQFEPHRAKALNLFSGSFSPAWGAPLPPPGRPDYSMNYDPTMRRPKENPFYDLSPVETMLAGAGYKQDGNKAPIANIWSALQGHKMTADEMARAAEARKQQGGLFSGLLDFFGGW